MTDYSERPPHMPPGWVAIPKAALKSMRAQAMLSGYDLTHLNDPDAYKRHVVVRMFIDIANLLQRAYEGTMEVRRELAERLDPAQEPVTDERWNLTIWCVDPEYLKAQEQRRSDSRTTERAQAT
jgi:hypothetical protein